MIITTMRLKSRDQGISLEEADKLNDEELRVHNEVSESDMEINSDEARDRNHRQWNLIISSHIKATGIETARTRMK
eukprot:12397923-Karenia_brevis.AAC.1